LTALLAPLLATLLTALLATLLTTLLTALLATLLTTLLTTLLAALLTTFLALTPAFLATTLARGLIVLRITTRRLLTLLATFLLRATHVLVEILILHIICHDLVPPMSRVPLFIDRPELLFEFVPPIS
jgi:hypothetical protein